MLTFWLIAAALILVGISVVAIPLLRGTPAKRKSSSDRTNVLVFQDQLAELNADVESGILSADQFEQGRLELERRLLEETSKAPEKDRPVQSVRNRRWLALLVGICISGLSLTIYAKIGRIDLVDYSPQVATQTSPHAAMQSAPHADSDVAMEQAVQALADRLAAQPNDPEGWVMLGRSYAALEKYQEATEAYQRAQKFTGPHPDLLVASADARLMASDGRFDSEISALVDQALELDPNNLKALWLAGTIAHQQGDYEKTLEIWQRAAAQAPEGSELARTMAANIAEARGLLENSKTQ